jgi:hypothetical protein
MPLEKTTKLVNLVTENWTPQNKQPKTYLNIELQQISKTQNLTHSQ